MRVIVLNHEKTGDKIYFPGSAVDDAMQTLEHCLLKQTKKAVADREVVSLSYGSMSKREFDELPTIPDGSC